MAGPEGPEIERHIFISFHPLEGESMAAQLREHLQRRPSEQSAPNAPNNKTKVTLSEARQGEDLMAYLEPILKRCSMVLVVGTALYGAGQEEGGLQTQQELDLISRLARPRMALLPLAPPTSLRVKYALEGSFVMEDCVDRGSGIVDFARVREHISRQAHSLLEDAAPRAPRLSGNNARELIHRLLGRWDPHAHMELVD
eukprot:m.197369 g.197369  ORF g.197369 m.197369 type:complete len:199 (+) comp15475_c0_seq4:85-681(+)